MSDVEHPEDEQLDPQPQPDQEPEAAAEEVPAETAEEPAAKPAEEPAADGRGARPQAAEEPAAQRPRSPPRKRPRSPRLRRARREPPSRAATAERAHRQRPVRASRRAHPAGRPPSPRAQTPRPTRSRSPRASAPRSPAPTWCPTSFPRATSSLTRRPAPRPRRRPRRRPAARSRLRAEETQPIADAAIDLAAGARYTATGKRKTAVARVILKPGAGRTRSTARRSTCSSRAPPCSASSASRWRPWATSPGWTWWRGCTAAACRPGRRAAPRDLAGAAGRRPEPAWRAQAPWLLDARPARQGAQEGRTEEGPQAAAVLQALTARLVHAAPAFRHGRVRGHAGDFLTAEMALSLARAAVARVGTARPQVLIVRDTRESGEMLEAAIAAGVTAAGGDALLGRRAADPGGAAARPPARIGPGRGHLRLAQPLRGQRDQAVRRRRLQAR